MSTYLRTKEPHKILTVIAAAVQAEVFSLINPF